MSKEPQLRISF